jgi:hypothetical protein
MKAQLSKPTKTLHPFQLTLLQILFFAIIGVPFAYIFDKEGYFFWLIRNVPEAMALQSYYWVVYGFILIIILYYLSGLNKKILRYQSLNLTFIPYKKYKNIWLLSFSLACLCFMVVFAQSGFSHPGLSAIGLTHNEYAVQRISSGQLFNRSILNIGLGLFASFSMVIALFILKKPIISFITIILTLLLALFSLQKSIIADTILLITFVYLFIKPLPWKKLFIIGVLCLLPIGTLWLISGGVSTMSMLSNSFSDRILYGQIGDLPYYFDLFEHDRLSSLSMLPPYIQSLYGEPVPSASQLVMEYTNPVAVANGTAGVASTVFIGEAYAVGGILGIILSPFIIFLNYFIIINIFIRLPKTIYSVFVFGYLFNKMTQAMLNSFGYFVFSSIQIIMFLVLYFGVIYILAVKKKRSETLARSCYFEDNDNSRCPPPIY